MCGFVVSIQIDICTVIYSSSVKGICAEEI